MFRQISLVLACLVAAPAMAQVYPSPSCKGGARTSIECPRRGAHLCATFGVNSAQCKAVATLCNACVAALQRCKAKVTGRNTCYHCYPPLEACQAKLDRRT